jgi:hypothetical protein
MSYLAGQLLPPGMQNQKYCDQGYCVKLTGILLLLPQHYLESWAARLPISGPSGLEEK